MSKKINILQLATWLTAATKDNKKFLLKPNDLRMIYLFVLWEHVKMRKPDAGGIVDDREISIPEDQLIEIVKMFFHNENYPFFNRVYNM